MILIFAPGENIKICTIDNKNESFSGTSAAAPFVTGLVALMKIKNPMLNSEEIKLLISQNSIKYNGNWNGESVLINLINFKKTLGAIT